MCVHHILDFYTRNMWVNLVSYMSMMDFDLWFETFEVSFCKICFSIYALAKKKKIGVCLRNIGQKSWVYYDFLLFFISVANKAMHYTEFLFTVFLLHHQIFNICLTAEKKGSVLKKKVQKCKMRPLFVATWQIQFHIVMCMSFQDKPVFLA